MSDLAQKKANVIAFYEMMFNDCRLREAIERYASDVRPGATAQVFSAGLQAAW